MEKISLGYNFGLDHNHDSVAVPGVTGSLGRYRDGTAKSGYFRLNGAQSQETPPILQAHPDGVVPGKRKKKVQSR